MSLLYLLYVILFFSYSVELTERVLSRAPTTCNPPVFALTPPLDFKIHAGKRQKSFTMCWSIYTSDKHVAFQRAGAYSCTSFVNRRARAPAFQGNLCVLRMQTYEKPRQCFICQLVVVNKVCSVVDYFFKHFLGGSRCRCNRVRKRTSTRTECVAQLWSVNHIAQNAAQRINYVAF